VFLREEKREKKRREREREVENENFEGLGIFIPFPYPMWEGLRLNVRPLSTDLLILIRQPLWPFPVIISESSDQIRRPRFIPGGQTHLGLYDP